MTKTRAALALAFAATALAGGLTSSAQAAPVCKLIVDPAGDHGYNGVNKADNQQDILSGDIAVDAKTVTGQLTLAAAPSGPNPFAIGGARWYVVFQPAGAQNPVYLSLGLNAAGTQTFSAGSVTTTAAGATSYSANTNVPVRGKVEGATITMTANLTDFAALAQIKPGTRISGLAAEAFALVGVLLVPGDEAVGKAYVAGQASCVKPVA